MRLKDINYDSPQLLKKKLEVGDIHPGKDWAKGYNLIIRKDPETKIPLILVKGWNSDQKKLKAVCFYASTGEYIVCDLLFPLQQSGPIVEQTQVEND